MCAEVRRKGTSCVHGKPFFLGEKLALKSRQVEYNVPVYTYKRLSSELYPAVKYYIQKKFIKL